MTNSSMIHEKRIFINTLYQVLGKIVTSGFGVLSFALLTHYLSISQIGEYNLIISFTGFLVVFADFGLTTLLIREVANHTANELYVGIVFSLRFFLSLFMTIIGICITSLLPYPEIVKIGIGIFSIANIFYLLSSVLWSVFQAKLQFTKVVIPQIITAGMTSAFIGIAIAVKLSFLLTFTLSSLGLVFGFLTTFVIYHKSIAITFSWKKFLPILTQGWPLGLGAIVSVCYFKIDSLILPYYYNPSTHPDLGYYSTAYRLFEVAIVFGGFYINTLYPFFSERIHEKDFIKIAKKYFLYTLTLTLCGSLFLYLFAHLLIGIIGGAKYLPSVSSLQILSLAAFASIMAGFFVNIALAGKRQVLILQFSTVAAVMNIILNIIIIPKYSFIGASWTTVLTQIFLLVTYAYTALLALRNKNL